MSVLRPIWLNLAILAAFGLQVEAVFGQVFNGLQKQAGIGQSTYGPHYFTIIGHIERPNSYELPTSSPSLVKFIEFAGNLTPSAAGSIRTVRNGRSVQSTLYRETSTERLLPGDILVVDGKINQGRNILRSNQKPAGEAPAEVSLAVTGLRDYPVVLKIPAERATIRWVTRHLGLDPAAANYVKAITQRQSDRVLPDTRLATGTVLVLNPAYVDQSRLPDDLPVPINAGRQPAPAPAPAPAQQAARPSAPVAQQPLTGPPGNQYGAAPGRARVPTIGSPPASRNAQEEKLDLPKAEQTFVTQLLTDPASVALDEPTPELSGRAFVPQRPDGIQSFQSSTNSSANAPGNGNTRPSAGATGSATVTDMPASAPAPARERAYGPARTIFSPEATRPYQSEPAAPETLQPLGSSRSVLEDAQPEPRPAADISRVEAGDAGNDNGDLTSSIQASRLAAATNNQSPQPSPVMPVQSAGELPTRANSSQANPATTATPRSSDGSRLLPPPPGGPNWPVISVCVVGLLGAIAACFLIYSIAHETPAPRVAQIDTSGRYWLDRMIENDIPIEEEEVDYPHNTQLFGKPAPIQRVDAAHRSVPRPHFSAPGGKSGVLSHTPMMPDAPAPENSDRKDTRIVRVHSGGPLRKQGAAAVPVPHSVETAAKRRDAASGLSEFAATAVFGDATQQADQSSRTVEKPTTFEESKAEASSAEASATSPQNPGRQFRLDTGHKADEKASRSATRHAGSRRPVTVRPSPVVVQGANLLDRILSSVEHEQTVARPKADASNRNIRQSDERGNS